MSSSFTTSDNVTISYSIKGSGSPLVFLHGFSLDKTMWEPQVEYFSPHYQVTTPDMRGFGQSSLPTKPYSHSRDLFELLSYLGVKNTHLVGLSLGGEAAIDFTLSYPEMVKTLTLADSSLGGFKSTVDWNVYAKEVGVEKAKENWLNHAVFAYSFKNPVVKQKTQKMSGQYSGWHWLHKDPREKLNPSAKERLKEIKQRVLILLGEHDLPYYFDIAECLQSSLPDSQKVVIPNAGHLVSMDNPDEFNKQLELLYPEVSTVSVRNFSVGGDHSTPGVE